jgi:AAA domain
MGFVKAERKRVKLKLGIAGPSGSGKTFSALRIAKGIGEAEKGHASRIALIDTENKSASLYAQTSGMPAFDTLELEPPYTVDKYIAAIELAIKEKYDFLIIDSISHVWSGEGGLLQEKELLDSRGGNSYTNWAKMTPKWNRLVSGVLHGDIHMICTMRSKQEHTLSQNDKGKTEVKKLGMAPQVRDGFEYELTAVFDMGMDHNAQASKDRTNLFDQRIWKPDEKTGAELHAWLMSGTAGAPTPPPAAAPEAPKNEAPPAQEPKKEDKPQLSHVQAFVVGLAKRHNWKGAEVTALVKAKFKKDKVDQLDQIQLDALYNTIETTRFDAAIKELTEGA